MVKRVLQLKHTLFLIILIEGYVVLASELLAIRLLISHVGSGVEIVSVIISGVLLPLAYGYYVGGQRYHQQREKALSPPSIRKWLLHNLLSAMVLLTLGLSFVFLEIFFALLNRFDITHHVVQTAIYTAVFLVYPIFLLAQTVPLISNYFSQETLSRVTGRMLFFSTIGSFLGSVFSTIVLMNTVGVHMTATITMCLLAAAAILLIKPKQRYEQGLLLLLLLVVFKCNSPWTQEALGIVNDNPYNTASIVNNEQEGYVELSLNNSRSSRYATNPLHSYVYIQYLEKTIFQQIPPGKRVLVIGAGGFTLGWADRISDYVFVDIDPDLKKIAEQHMLPEPLPENKTFVPKSARTYLQQTEDQFDVIVVDAFTNQQSIPLEVTTTEFWQSVRQHLKPNGVVAANFIVSPHFENLYSARIARTFNHVFPNHYRQLVVDIDIWNPDIEAVNMLFIHRSTPHDDDRVIYTDDLTTYSLDRHRTK